MKRLPFEFDGVVRITRVGAIFLVSTLLVGFAALNTGNNSLYIALSFMLGTLLVSGIVSHRGLRSINVTFHQIDEAWARKPAGGSMKLNSRSRFFAARDVIVVSPQLYRPVLIPSVEKGADAHLDMSFIFEHRGRTHLSRLDLYSRYPFGLFLKKRSVAIHGETIVYPQLLDREIEATKSEAIEGELRPVARSGTGTELHGFRDYVRGDSLRQVHWKKSASSGRWIMKQNEAESGRTLTVVVDSFFPSPALHDAFEEMISKAATLIHDALDQELTVVLITPGETLLSAASGGRRAIFERLALIAPTSARGELFPSIPKGAAVFTLRRSDDLKSA